MADSHDVIRRTVRTTLDFEPTWTVCAEATTGLETLAKATEFTPDVVVMDVGLPGLAAVELTREIRRAAPSAHVVALTMRPSQTAGAPSVRGRRSGVRAESGCRPIAGQRHQGPGRSGCDARDGRRPRS